MDFYKDCWAIIKDDLLRVFSEFHASGKLVKGCNSSFIALIPKKSGVNCLNHFRPISLIGSLYKILAKVLASRLKSVLGKIIGETQSAFLRERSILDGVVILNEAIEDARSSKAKRLFFKVDFAKAFDSVSWNYLLDLKRKLQFPEKWVLWIKECISTAKANVLVNGSPSGEFALERGLRQGDPLSPLLFLIAAEGLNLLVKRAVDMGLLRPAVIGRNRTQLSHLQYADDTMFVVEGRRENALAIKHLLNNFDLVSGLSVNFEKSWAFGVNLGREELENMVAGLGCRVGNLPIPHLGLKVGGRLLGAEGWGDLVEKVKGRLRRWDVKSLSMGGRITIIKSILTALPVYGMSVLHLPKMINKSLRSLFNNFLWGGTEGARKMTWIKWEDLCLSPFEGGIGFKNLISFNKALLLKWVWRFLNEGNCLWKRVIISRHGEQWWTRRGAADNGAGPTGWWKKILALVDSEEGRWFWDKVERRIGDGNHTLFWEDKWIGRESLKTIFPRLFHLSAHHSAKIGDMGHWVEGVWNWDITWKRPLRYRDENEAKQLYELLNSVSLSVGSSDCWVWKGATAGGFSTKKAYDEIEKIRRGTALSSRPSFPYSIIWKSAAPFKSRVMAWRLAWDRLPTLENLRRRVNASGEDWLCCCCKLEIESAQHFFIECSEVHNIWNKIVQWCGFYWAAPRKIGDHFLSFIESIGKGKTKFILGGLWICVVWILWKWRNSVKFEQIAWNFRRIEEEIKGRFWSWCIARGVAGAADSFVSWSRNHLCELLDE